MPLSTKSYALARTRALSDSRYGRHSSIGAVNGWCIATNSPSSSSYSKNGNSVIHNRLNWSFGIMSSFCATVWRSAPSVVSTWLSLASATTSSTSPVSAPVLVRIACISASDMNFANEDAMPSWFMRTQARPFAPMPRTNSVNLSISFLVKTLATFFALIARTLPPPSTAPRNTPNSLSRTASVKSQISIS